MLNVLDSTKELYTQSSQKNLVITFPNRNITLINANIVYESVELKESIETEDQLNFKGCNSSSFKFSCAEINYDLRNEYVEATIQAGTSEIIPLFSGYVVSQTNRTNEDVVTEFECQDILYSIRNQDVTSWYNGLTFPITVKNFRNSFFTLLGIDQVVDIHDPNDTGDLINDSLTLTKIDSAKLPKVLNAGTIMEDLCQINARYGQYGRDKKFHYRQLREIMKGLYPSYETFPSPTTYPSGENADSRYDLSAYSKISYEPYTVEKITGVTIRDNEGNATSKGTATNVFTIADNMLASSLSDKATACQNILNEVKVVWYIPLNLECVGYPWIECGDVLLTRTKKNIVRSYVLQRTLKGIQALFDTIESEGLQTREEYRESEATGVSTNRAGVKDNADEIIRTNQIVATKATITDLNAERARINTLYGTTIIADAVNYGTLDGKYITANSIKANQLTSGCVTADKIEANSITVDKLNSTSLSSWTLSCQGLSCTNLWFGGVRCGTKRFDQLSDGDIVVVRNG
jgi:hypothetical protein